jgi:hypothetical protein
VSNEVFVAIFTSFIGAFVCIMAAIKIRKDKKNKSK